MDTIFVATQTGGGGAFDSRFILGVLSGVAVAVLTGVLVFLFQKYTLEGGLVASIQIRQTRLREFDEFLVALRPYLAVGAVPGYSMRVTPEPSDFFVDVRGQIYRYYSGANAARLILFYSTCDRIEILLKGLGDDLSELRNGGTVLDPETHDNLHRRIARIVDMIEDCRVDGLERVAELPLDYGSRTSAASVLTGPSATTHEQV